LAAHGLKQLTYKASRMHMTNVCEIAFTAGEEDYTQLLGVLYDELVREHWASMSQKVRTFKIEEQVFLSVRVLFVCCVVPDVAGAIGERFCVEESQDFA
jgi:hypothetical protein